MPVAVTKTDYHTILDLEKGATEDDIRVAYKKLVRWHSWTSRFRYAKHVSRHQALKWHPDRHQEHKDEAQAKFVEVCHNSGPTGAQMLTFRFPAGTGCLSPLA